MLGKITIKLFQRVNDGKEAIVRIDELELMAKRMRRLAIEMAHNAGNKGAHLGGGLSVIEIFAVLYGAILNVNPDNPYDEERDIVLLGKAHGVLGYYTALYEKGFLSEEDINSFEVNGSMFIGHPVRNIKKGIEYSGGSLGMALSVGVGLALSAKVKNKSRKIYVILGDGECQEGAVWEALFSASKYKLDNLIVIVDNNKIQSDGFTYDIAGYDNLAMKAEAFGCHVSVIDGHNISSILNSLQESSLGLPKVLIANTVKGKGISFMENNYKWHHAVLSDKDYSLACSELLEGKYAGN